MSLSQDSLENVLINFCRPLFVNKKCILATTCVGFILGLIISISLPSKYKVEVTLSPESGQTNNNLTGVANMLGLNGINATNQDALNSTMLPDILNSTPFILEMYNIKVQPHETTKSVLLSDYVVQQKAPWWIYILRFPSFIITKLSTSSSEENEDISLTIDPFRLTKEQTIRINAIKGALTSTTEGSMTIVSATFQDPEVAATVADSAVAKLQKYIIDYRTRKAQEDCNYLEKLCKERKEEYYKAQKAYADFMDANRNVVLQRTQAEGTRLQNDMSIAFQIYSQVETQLQVARAKVQEAKPVFAIVEPATVPLSPSSPNKKIIILGLMFLGFIGSSAWILFGKELWQSLRNTKKASND